MQPRCRKFSEGADLEIVCNKGQLIYARQPNAIFVYFKKNNFLQRAVSDNLISY